ncbi:hypothetical protein [Nafulsella turpanensis]|uniref:hypothetical protein n=1 Tax=Nafulsella turpanensis TaxID=1265690 RepID=UPI000344BCFF|nr:hypothetical protein [Nafulsella turpanensis]
MLSFKEIQKTGIAALIAFIFSATALYAQNSALNVNEIKSIEATYLKGRGVQLSWATKFNDTTDYFIVERSLDGLTFEALTEASYSNTQTNHKFIDRNPYKGVSYYRLQVIDYNGEANISRVVSIYLEGSGKPELVLYPMPVGNAETLNLSFKGVEQSFKAMVYVTDQTGRRIISKEVEITSVHAASELDLQQKLSPGNYQLTIVAHTGLDFRIGKLLQIID